MGIGQEQLFLTWETSSMLSGNVRGLKLTWRENYLRVRSLLSSGVLWGPQSLDITSTFT